MHRTTAGAIRELHFTEEIARRQPDAHHNPLITAAQLEQRYVIQESNDGVDVCSWHGWFLDRSSWHSSMHNLAGFHALTRYLFYRLVYG